MRSAGCGKLSGAAAIRTNYYGPTYFGDHRDKRSYTTNIQNIQNIQQQIPQTPPDLQATLQKIIALLEWQEASADASQKLIAETQALGKELKNKPGLWELTKGTFGELHALAKQVEQDVAPYARYVEVFGVLVTMLV